MGGRGPWKCLSDGADGADGLGGSERPAAAPRRREGRPPSGRGTPLRHAIAYNRLMRRLRVGPSNRVQGLQRVANLAGIAFSTAFCSLGIALPTFLPFRPCRTSACSPSTASNRASLRCLPASYRRSNTGADQLVASVGVPSGLRRPATPIGRSPEARSAPPVLLRFVPQRPFRRDASRYRDWLESPRNLIEPGQGRCSFYC